MNRFLLSDRFPQERSRPGEGGDGQRGDEGSS